MERVATALGILLAVLMVLLLAGGAMMGHYGGMMGHYGNYGGMMNGYGFNSFGAILSFAVWVLIISALVVGCLWLARRVDRRAPKAESGDSPVDILKRRYAKGEITKEEFESIKRDLAA